MGYVHNMERHQDRLNILSAWLTLHELESAQVHTEEAENLEVDTTALAERVLEGIHNYVPPPAAPAIPKQLPGSPIFPSGLRLSSIREGPVAPNKKVAPNATAPKPFAISKATEAPRATVAPQALTYEPQRMIRPQRMTRPQRMRMIRPQRMRMTRPQGTIRPPVDAPG